MKDFFITIGGILVCVFFIYLIWALFIPLAIGSRAVERKVTEQSQQYVATQRVALNNFYRAYTEADSQERKSAIKGQMCDIMAGLTASEVPSHIKGAVVCR
jgi:hypothetical protein